MVDVPLSVTVPGNHGGDRCSTCVHSHNEARPGVALGRSLGGHEFPIASVSGSRLSGI